MAEFQWWLLIVGLVAGAGLVAVISMDGRRREEDLGDLERQAETTWIADRLSRRDPALDPRTVEAVLGLHRQYLSLPPPDRLIVAGEAGPAETSAALDHDPDRPPHDVRDDGGRSADEDLAGAGVEHAPTGQEAHAGAHGEQRPDR